MTIIALSTIGVILGFLNFCLLGAASLYLASQAK